MVQSRNGEKIIRNLVRPLENALEKSPNLPINPSKGATIEPALNQSI